MRIRVPMRIRVVPHAHPRMRARVREDGLRVVCGHALRVADALLRSVE
jgi:hypothetical protein